MKDKMHKIVFEPMGLSIRVPEGANLLEAAVSLEIPIRSDCGGNGLCGKCVVQVDSEAGLSPMTDAEKDLFDENEQSSGHRLACQAKVSGPVRVAVPRGTLDIGAALGKTDIDAVFDLHPMVERTKADGAHTGPENEEDLPSDRATLLTSRVSGKAGAADINGLKDMAKPDRFRGDMTLVNHRKRGVTAVLTGNRQRSFGVAVDVGTTTVACYLCDMTSGGIIASRASANPQRRFGEDVISRIAFCDSRESGTEILREAVVQEINGLIDGCIEEVDGETQDVDEVSIVGNTTMQHLFCGIHPHGLGVSPYLPVFAGALNLSAAEIGFSLNPGTNVYIFPVVSGFVGGDTLGAVVAEKPHRSKQTTLIVDIGTNGEVVLGTKDGLWATSCATGPALEGAQLECGMRAMPGAVHRVSYDDPNGFEFEIIGGSSEPARGLCGSGVIDAVASMLRAGIMLPNGRLKEGAPGVVVDGDGIGRSFELVPPGYSSTGRPVFVSLNDVRQIQLAKAALRVGIEALMRRAGVNYIDT
ncbi:MAG TPA: DUF4445 domain-containing protein, partial [Desulfobacteraceae bacterium]|nr:DUF4445 domain-containing protein [Desulfobacteraceae bacterium]